MTVGNHDVFVLAAKLDAIKDTLEDIKDRAEEDRDLGDKRHHQNVNAINSVRDEWRKTNGRVTALETLNEASNRWPSLKVWLGIVAGALGAAWFLLTQVLGFHRP